MILVTGAAGKTGRQVIRRLADTTTTPVRAMVHTHAQVEPSLTLGAREAMAGDLLEIADVMCAMDGVRTVYHICPNVHPREVEIGEAVISAARGAGVDHLVYHSVLYPDVEAMPHHWLKFQVERSLQDSGLPFTILRPCAYMQNLRPQVPQMAEHGKLEVPYDVEAEFSLVDLQDIAAAAATVLSGSGHEGHTYDLCGPERLSHTRIATAFESALSRPVEAIQVDPADWEKKARSSGLRDYAVDALMRMFLWYDRNGFVGSSSDLEGLLGKPAGSFDEYARRASGT